MALSQREKSILLVGVLLGGLLLVALGKARLSTPCVKAQAKVDAADQFCLGLAHRAVEDNCSQLEGVQGAQCQRIVVQLAKDACYGLIDMDGLKEQALKVCS